MSAIQQKIPPIDEQLPGYPPVRTLEVELEHPLPTISAFDEKRRNYHRYAQCLVRLHTQPLGLVELKFDVNELGPEEYAPKIWQALNVQINDHLRQDELPPITRLPVKGVLSLNVPRCIEEREQFLANAPFVSVIVPTHDRPEQLATCLHSLMSLHYPRYEVIVVDNAPNTKATADLIQMLSDTAPYIHYVREDQAGPSWARNRGIRAANGAILAFADDDAVVDPYWLIELVRAFSVNNDVACVTGLVLPLELETPAQILFEEYGGFNKGFTRRIYKLDKKDLDPQERLLHPYVPGRFGTGASMAFTSAFLRKTDRFDPALGGSGPSRCGQDVAVFFQAIIEGHKLVYQPAALLYHLHRRDYAGLRKQIYNYGIGLTAFLTKVVLENPLRLFDLLAKVPFSIFLLVSSRSLKNRNKSKDYPRDLIILERKGMLYGPLAYALSRWKMRKISKTLPLNRGSDQERLEQGNTALSMKKAYIVASDHIRERK